MRAAAILLAAGRGRRLGADRPKALLEVGGATMLHRAVRTIDDVRGLEGFLVAAPEGHEEEMKATAAGAPRFLALVTGGGSRQESVRRSLEALPAAFDAVVVHDVARPFASPSLFEAVLGALGRAEGAVPVLPVADTVKRVTEDLVVETVSREGLALAQTPQAFLREALERVHRVAGDDGVVATDDAALFERLGLRVAAVPGDPDNIKVTTPEDLERAELLARGRP